MAGIVSSFLCREKIGGERFADMDHRYGEDKELTEGYEKDIWEFGY